MKPEIGATYENADQRRTVTKVTSAGKVSFTILWYRWFFGFPPRLTWQQEGEVSGQDTKMEWGKWAAWATKVVDEPARNR